MRSLKNIRFRVSRKLSHFLLYHYFKGAKYLRNKLCRWLVPAAEGPIICSTIFDVDMLVDPVLDKGLERSIYYFGEYEAGTLSVLRNFLHKGDVFLDVGANIGFLSCVVARFVGNGGWVYAVEPHPEIYRILKENIRINKLKNVRCLNIALGAKVSHARIYDNPSVNRGSASLIRPQGVIEESGKEVKVTAIDTLLENKQLRTPTLIKIDVEGFELEVLKGAKTLLEGSQAPMLCVEYSNLHPQSKGSTLDIHRFIKSVNNYSVYKLQHGKGIPSKLIKISEEHELPYHDNIFCFLDKHLNKLKRSE